MLGLALIFLAKFVFHWIPDPPDDTLAYSVLVGVIMLLAGILANIWNRRLGKMESQISSNWESDKTTKTDIALIKQKLHIS